MRTVTMEPRWSRGRRVVEAEDEERGGVPATLLYSFFGPVVALMSSYARRGRNRSATRPGITSRATQLRAKGPSCDLRGDSTRTDGEREPFIPGPHSPSGR